MVCVRASNPRQSPPGSSSAPNALQVALSSTYTRSPRYPLYLVAAHTPPNLRAQGEPVSRRRRVIRVTGDDPAVTDQGDHEACPGIATGAGQRE